MTRLFEDNAPLCNNASPARIEERRRAARPDTPLGYLQQLPAVVLLQRIQMPIIAVDSDSIIIYANPACTAMLGYGGGGLTGLPLSRLMITDPTSPPLSANTLRALGGTITTWRHLDDGVIKVVISETMLLRTDDPIVLVGLTEVTERLWTYGTDGSALSQGSRSSV